MISEVIEIHRLRSSILFSSHLEEWECYVGSAAMRIARLDVIRF